MDTNPPKSTLESVRLRAASAIVRVTGFLQTPLGSAIGGGLVVVLIAHYLFGIG